MSNTLHTYEHPVKPIHVNLNADLDADNPFNWGWEGIAVYANDSRSIDSGDTHHRDELEGWTEDRDRLEDEVNYCIDDWQKLENYRHENNGDIRPEVELELSNAIADLLGAVETLADHEGDKPAYLFFDGADGYTVSIDPEVYGAYIGVPADDMEALKRCSRGYLDTYLSWANGSVWSLEVVQVDSDGNHVSDLDRLSGVYLGDYSSYPTDEELWQFVETDMDLTTNWEDTPEIG